MHAVFATQGLADLQKIDPVIQDQVLNCVNTLSCYRLNDQNSAETIANWIGTKETFTLTAQTNAHEADAGLGTVNQTKEYIVHPDAIKQQLRTGEANYVTKVNGLRCDWVKVKY